jgi:hypothetical protein
MELSMEQAFCGLTHLDDTCCQLKNTLFDLCCQVQRDCAAVDFDYLGSIMLRLREAETERATLLQSLVASGMLNESTEAESE